MRRVVVFKSYESSIEYNPLTGEFITVTNHPEGCEPSQDEMLAALAQILDDAGDCPASHQQPIARKA